MARTTALENVELPLIYQGVEVDERRERAMAALPAQQRLNRPNGAMHAAAWASLEGALVADTRCKGYPNNNKGRPHSTDGRAEFWEAEACSVQ